MDLWFSRAHVLFFFFICSIIVIGLVLWNLAHGNGIPTKTIANSLQTNRFARCWLFGRRTSANITKRIAYQLCVNDRHKTTARFRLQLRHSAHAMCTSVGCLFWLRDTKIDFSQNPATLGHIYLFVLLNERDWEEAGRDGADCLAVTCIYRIVAIGYRWAAAFVAF